MYALVVVGSITFFVAAPASSQYATMSQSNICPNPIVAKICRSVHSDARFIRTKETKRLSDGEIAYIYLQANLFEVEIAKLGRENATDPDVKAHGEMVARDHGNVVKQFSMLLEKIGVKPRESQIAIDIKSKHEVTIKDLRSKSGAEFDRAYIAFGVKNHTEVINSIKTVILPAAQNSAISAHFKNVLPAFEHHLQAIIKIANKLGIQTDK